MSAGRAPNRVLDLAELDEPFFAAVLARLDALVARDDISYLHPSKRWEYPWALERARLEPGQRVLDAGCGASIFPVYLAQLGCEVCAIDLEVPGTLSACHGVDIDYCEAELTRLPYRDESFDVAFCISVIEHLGHEGAPHALEELRRVVRPGGLVLLTTDFYQDASAELRYEGRDGSFPVDWGFFDEPLVHRYLLDAPGLQLDGALDLTVDWPSTSARMRRFHGYPYTAVGLALRRRP